jgi:hypothetical protein
MKTLTSTLLFLTLILVTITSCKKYPISEPTQDITGQWVWLSTWYILPLSDSNPKTPQTTGIQELIVFRSDKTWHTTRNNIPIDSGTFSTGHGTYLPYAGADRYIYDSIVYYKTGIVKEVNHDYYKIYNDTLQFSSGFAGIKGGGSKFYKRQN